METPDQAQPSTPEPIPAELVIAFAAPIEFGGVNYSQITLREPTAGQMAAWDKLSGAEADIVAVHTVAAVPRQVVEKMTARDFIKGARYLGRFLD